MSNSIKVSAVAVCICIMAVVFSQYAEGASSSCSKVITAMQPCRTYLKQGGTLPKNCCDGVRTLKTAATTTELKKSYCECLKSEAKSLGVKQQYASDIPKKCNVDIGYPISYNVDCTKVH